MNRNSRPNRLDLTRPKVVSFLGVIFLSTAISSGQQGAISTPVRYQINRVEPSLAAVGDTIEIHVDRLHQWIADSHIDPHSLVLFIDTTPVKGLRIECYEEEDLLRVRLKNTQESKEIWNELLGEPQLKQKAIHLGIGTQSSGPLLSSKYELITIPTKPFAISVVIVAISLLLFLWLARNTSIIRDNNPTELNPRKKAYSLAKFQMAVWYFLVLAAFLFIWAIEGSWPVITDQVLGLIGIASGTALGAVGIDTWKANAAQEALATSAQQASALATEIQDHQAALAASAADPQRERGIDLGPVIAVKNQQLNLVQQKIHDLHSLLGTTQPVTFLKDVLSDANGISFHRFQMFVWTVVLALLFCISVWRQLRMPSFDNSLLTLMGISSGTFLGFKYPEKK